jgi:excisionase family DNA binding protein
VDRYEPLLLKVSEAARLLGVSKSTAYIMAAKRELPTIRMRGGLRVPADALKAWIVEKMAAAAVAATTEGDASSYAHRRQRESTPLK